MSAISEIRAKYTLCIEAAQKAETLEERVRFLALASAWELLAS